MRSGGLKLDPERSYLRAVEARFGWLAIVELSTNLGQSWADQRGR